MILLASNFLTSELKNNLNKKLSHLKPIISRYIKLFIERL